MRTYDVLIQLPNYVTANVIVYADNDYLAKQIAEAQYGLGNVLSYTCINSGL